MSITALEVDLARRGVSFVHLTPNYRTALAAKAAFEQAVLDQGLTIREGLYVRFLACTLSGCCMPHVPVLIVEDAHLIKDRQALDEAKFIAASMDGHPQTVIHVTN